MIRASGTFLFLSLAGSLAQAATVDYIREVKPILAEHCYRCHGASQQKGGLRMDTAVFAVKGGDTGPAYKPGKSADSLMIQAVKGTHDDNQHPRAMGRSRSKSPR
jgi:hypothetical protein